MGYKKHNIVLCFFYLWAVIRDSTNGLETRIHNIYKQIDLNTHKESQCICLENDPSLPTMPQLLDPNQQGLQRLIIFIYKDSTGNIQLYIPGAEKQAIIPDPQIEPSDISTQVTDDVTVLSLFTYADRIIHIHPTKTNDDNVKDDDVKFPKGHKDTQFLDDFSLIETTTYVSEDVPHYPVSEDHHHHNRTIHTPKGDDQQTSRPVYTYLPKVDFFGGQDLDSPGKETVYDDLSADIDSNAALEPTIENDQSPEMYPESEHDQDDDLPGIGFDPVSEPNVQNSHPPHTELDPTGESLDYITPNTDLDPGSEQTVDDAEPSYTDSDQPSIEAIDSAQSGIDFDPTSEQNFDYAQPGSDLDSNFDNGQPPDLGLASEEIIDHAQHSIDFNTASEPTFDYAQPDIVLDPVSGQNFDNSQPPEPDLLSQEILHDGGGLPLSKELDSTSTQTVDDAQPPQVDLNSSSSEEYDDDVSNNQDFTPVSEETTPGATAETKTKISDLTFSQWFATQMKNMETKTSFINRPLDMKSIKMLIMKSLMEHGLYISGDGKLTDSKGRIINMSNLHIRPLLIGETVEYDKLVASQYTNFVLPKNLQYYESLLITLVYPPKIIGIIPMGKLYLPTRLSQTTALQPNIKSEYPELRNYDHNIVKYTSPIEMKSKRMQISLSKKSPQNRYIKGLKSENLIKAYLDRARHFLQKPVANENEFSNGADNKKYNQIASQYIEQSRLGLGEEFSVLNKNGRPNKKMGKHTPSTYRTSEPQELSIGDLRSHKASRKGNDLVPEEEATIADREKLLNFLKFLQDRVEHVPEKEGEEDVKDEPEIRIIGGSAAIGSGVPINSRGRSGLYHHG